MRRSAARLGVRYQRRTRVLMFTTELGAAATGAPAAITVGCGRSAIIMNMSIMLLLPKPLLLGWARSLSEVCKVLSCSVILSFVAVVVDFPPTTFVSSVGLILCIVVILWLRGVGG
jgi:hypothetical protein